MWISPFRTGVLWMGLRMALVLSVVSWPVWAQAIPLPASPEWVEIAQAIPDETPALAAPETEATQLTVFLEKTETYPIDLPTVLELVEDQNLTISAARWGEKLAQSQYRLSMSDLLPDITLTHDQNRFQGAVQIFGGDTIPILRSTVRPQITASWTVHPFGRDVLRTLAAKRREGMAKSLLEGTHQTQLARAAEEYYAFLVAHHQVEASRKGVEVAQEQVRLNQARFEVGIGTKLELMQSRTFQAEQQRALINAENQQAMAEQTLLNRLNLDPLVRLAPADWTLTPKTLAPADWPIPAMTAMAFENHPEKKKMETELKALGLDLKAEWADFLPSVTLQSYMNWTGPRTQDLALSRYGGLTVQLNLLENLGTKHPLLVQEKKREIAQKLVELAQLKRDIERNVLNAVLTSHAAEASVEVARTGVETSQESQRLSVGRFRVGLSTNLDVIENDRAYANALQTLNQEIDHYNQAQVRLLEALGRVSAQTLVNGLPEIASDSSVVPQQETTP